MLPLTLIVPLSTTTVAVYCLFGNEFNAKTTYYLRSVVGFGGLIVDTTALTLSINYAVASFTSDRSPLLQKPVHGYFAVVISIAFAFGFIVSNMLRKFFQIC
uniref:MARVEL domain-containing protein n=1 Tax=Panagrellus redivivus TaxID=6233 RepID=A0A7E4ZVR9_PANRE